MRAGQLSKVVWGGVVQRWECIAELLKRFARRLRLPAMAGC